MKTYIEIIGGVLALVLVGAGAFFLASRAGSGPDARDVAASVPVATLPVGWQKGNPNARVSVAEFGDFQCPACRLYYPVMKLLAQEFGDRVSFSYIHFPLRNIHAHAAEAARAAEAAGAQGKFWEMHDFLFEKQGEWASAVDTKKIFEGYAAELGLDIALFVADRDDVRTDEKIQGQYDAGITAGVAGTPTFFVNGVIIPTPRSYDEFRTIIKRATEEAR